METYYLSRLSDGWVTFKPRHPTLDWTPDRQVTFKEELWKRMGNPVEIQIVIEGVKPWRDKVFPEKD
jgi:hypothetical protein